MSARVPTILSIVERILANKSNSSWTPGRFSPETVFNFPFSSFFLPLPVRNVIQPSGCLLYMFASSRTIENTRSRISFRSANLRQFEHAALGFEISLGQNHDDRFAATDALHEVLDRILVLHFVLIADQRNASGAERLLKLIDDCFALIRPLIGNEDFLFRSGFSRLRFSPDNGYLYRTCCRNRS